MLKFTIYFTDDSIREVYPRTDSNPFDILLDVLNEIRKVRELPGNFWEDHVRCITMEKVGS